MPTKSRLKKNKSKRKRRRPSKKSTRKKKTKSKKTRILPITRNQMILFNGLQKTGANKIYEKDWNSTKNRPRVMEYSGFLDFNRKGLEKAIVDDRALALDEEEATDYNSYHIYSPETYDYNDDFEYNFHTIQNALEQLNDRRSSCWRY